MRGDADPVSRSSRSLATTIRRRLNLFEPAMPVGSNEDMRSEILPNTPSMDGDGCHSSAANPYQ